MAAATVVASVAMAVEGSTLVAVNAVVAEMLLSFVATPAAHAGQCD